MLNRLMVRGLFLVGTVGLLVGASATAFSADTESAVSPQADHHIQPKMKAALGHLKTAKGFLKRSAHNKGGHRVAAIGLVNRAITQVKKGMKHDRHHEDASTIIEMGQPLMRKALNHLKKARTNLQKAKHDKGGHRVKALGLVNSAIAQVNKGLRHARRK